VHCGEWKVWKKARQRKRNVSLPGLTRTLLVKGKWNQRSKLLKQKKTEEVEKEHATVKERKKQKKKRNGEREKQSRTIVGCEDVLSSHT